MQLTARPHRGVRPLAPARAAIARLRELIGFRRPSAWRFARIVDLVVLLLLAFMVAASARHGFYLEYGGRVLFSMRSPGRLLVVALSMAVFRHVFLSDRHPRLAWWLRGDDDWATRPAPMAGRRRLGVALGVIALFAALTVLMTWPYARDLRLVSDPGDPLFSAWRLAWVAHQLPTDPRHLFDGNIFYPHPKALAYSDAVILPAVVGAPFLWAGADPVVVENVLFLAAFALSGAATAALVWALTGSAGASLVAGVIFGFMPYRGQHYSHLELQMTMWLPLALLALHRTVARTRVKDGVTTGAFVAAQVWSCIYYGVFLATYLVPVWLVLSRGWTRIRSTVKPLAAGALLCAVLAAPLLPPYLYNRSALGERGPGEVQYYSALPSAYLTAHGSSLLYGKRVRLNPSPECELFPGVVPVVLAVLALWPPLSTTRLAYGVGLAVSYDLSLGLNGSVYPWLYRWAPAYRGLRVPARFDVFVALSLAVLGGFAVARLGARLRSAGARTVLAIGVAALAMIDSSAPPHLVPAPEPPAEFCAYIKQAAPVILVEVPFGVSNEKAGGDAPYEYFSTWHWQRLVNGMSGYYPSSYIELEEKMKTFPTAACFAELRRLGVTHLAVHQASYDPRDFAEVRDTLAGLSDVQFIGRFGPEGSAVLLYQLTGTRPASRPGGAPAR